MNEISNIVWSYEGKPDIVAGTNATIIEKTIAWSAGFIGVAIIGFYYWKSSFDWAIWQYAIATIIIYDVVGGAVANSLNSCKRFYHSPVRAIEPIYVTFAKNHLFFSIIHVHCLVISFVFPTATWFYGLFWYLFLQVSLVVNKIPLYLQRPVSMLFVVTALLINSYLIDSPAGFEWLVPVLFIKIVYGHAVKEEPYRPVSEKSI